MTQFQRRVHQISHSFCYYWVVLVQLSLSTEFASCKIFARDGSHCFHDVKGFIFFLAIFLQDSKWSEETKKERSHWLFVDMSSILDPYEDFSAQRSVLIEGEPGVGKPNHCKKYAYNWATKKQEPQSCGSSAFKAVLLLKCRDVWSTAPPRHR